MADSGQDPKVEDVLSSVRRLVSQEIPKPPVAPSPPQDGALVLTSKDRIKADHTARVTARTLEQRIAELEAAVDGGSDEFEPDGSEDPSVHRPDRIVYTRPRSSETEVQQDRSPLRLSEISVVAPAKEAETEAETDGPVEFRRIPTRKPWDDPAMSAASVPEAPAAEAPTSEAPVENEPVSNAAMAEAAKSDAPLQDPQVAEVSVPEAPMAEDVPTLPASSADLRAFSDPDDVVARIEARIERGESETSAPLETPDQKPPESEDFDTALSAAVRASLAVADELVDEADTADTLSLEETIADTAPGVKSALSIPRIDGAGEVRLEEPSEAAEAAAELEQPSGSLRPAAEAQKPPEVAQTVAEPVEPSQADRADNDLEDSVTETARVDAIPSAESVAQAPEVGSAEAAASATDAAVSALAALPDDEATRLLVARLLREELQGDLGKQITRNVRKLVRSEILRVIETRTLD